jgi:hypothetical protein
VFINMFNAMLSAWICEALFLLAFQFNEKICSQKFQFVRSFITYNLFTSYFRNRP